MLNNIPIRKTIAIGLTGLFIYLCAVGKIDGREFVTIYAIVIGFYFGKSTALDIPVQNNNKEDVNK